MTSLFQSYLLLKNDSASNVPPEIITDHSMRNKISFEHYVWGGNKSTYHTNSNKSKKNGNV